MICNYTDPTAAKYLKRLIAENDFEDLAGIEFTRTRDGKIKGLQFDRSIKMFLLAEIVYQIEYLDEMREQEGSLLDGEAQMLKSFRRLRRKMTTQ